MAQIVDVYSCFWETKDLKNLTCLNGQNERYIYILLIVVVCCCQVDLKYRLEEDEILVGVD